MAIALPTTRRPSTSSTTTNGGVVVCRRETDTRTPLLLRVIPCMGQQPGSRTVSRRTFCSCVPGAWKGAVRTRTQALNHLQALATTAPESLREKLRGLKSQPLAERCARLRLVARRCDEGHGTTIALRAVGRRIQHLNREISELDAEIEPRVRALAPSLLDETGIGPVNAAEMVCAWSHPGRVRSEAAFANLAGVAPIPASSGQTVRHRLNRCGDRKLNRALHSAVLVRCARHEETRRYVERRRAEGMSDREIRRCLKRFLARRVFKLLEAQRRPQSAS